jgi:hypothetical protein
VQPENGNAPFAAVKPDKSETISKLDLAGEIK